MEKLILQCGAFVAEEAGDTQTRVRAMELYLTRLSRELEYLLEELDQERELRTSPEALEEGRGGEEEWL